MFSYKKYFYLFFIKSKPAVNGLRRPLSKDSLKVIRSVSTPA